MFCFRMRSHHSVFFVFVVLFVRVFFVCFFFLLLLFFFFSIYQNVDHYPHQTMDSLILRLEQLSARRRHMYAIMDMIWLVWLPGRAWRMEHGLSWHQHVGLKVRNTRCYFRYISSHSISCLVLDSKEVDYDKCSLIESFKLIDVTVALIIVNIWTTEKTQILLLINAAWPYHSFSPVYLTVVMLLSGSQCSSPTGSKGIEWHFIKCIYTYL